MTRRFHLTPARLAIPIALIVGAALTVLLQHTLFDGATAHPVDESGDTVRIAAQRMDDGDVQFALQQQIDGSWGEYQLPRANILPASAPAGQWRVSSNLVTEGSGVAESPLYCLITHGSDDDYFWRAFRAYVHVARVELAANVRYGNFLDGADQAAAIKRCSDDGALVIASTLADPESVTAPLLAAKAAGSRIITFNSGADFAAEAGSELHIALDDTRAGELAGELFSAEGLDGTIICVVHEEGNTGLVERCDGLESTYDGNVEHLHLSEGAGAEQVQAELEERLRDTDQSAVAGVFALNSDTMLALYEAVIAIRQDTDHAIRIGVVGEHPGYARYSAEDKAHHLSFDLSDMVEHQAYQTTASLIMVGDLHTPAALITQPLIMLAEPYQFDTKKIIGTSREMLDRFLRTLLQLQSAPDEWDEGW